MVKKKVKEPSQEFQEKKKIIEMQKECDEVAHTLKMRQLEYKRQTHHIKHEKELELGRIKTAEIRKTMMMRR